MELAVLQPFGRSVYWRERLRKITNKAMGGAVEQDRVMAQLGPMFMPNAFQLGALRGLEHHVMLGADRKNTVLERREPVGMAS